jgi:D-amino-acid oxidase
LAHQFAPRVTSVVAGALWEWPPAVCGRHQDAVSLERAKNWSEISYQMLADLASDSATGVFLRPVTFYFKRPIAEDPQQTKKVEEYKGKVKRFRHDPALMLEHGINMQLGYRDAYTHLAPMVDTDVYLDWLSSEVQRAGCRVTEGKVVGSLRSQEQMLLREYEAEAIVNCTGLGARELTGELVTPLRGALIRVHNDGVDFPRITQAHCVSQDGSMKDRGFIFIVPRGHNMLVLGGLAEPLEWEVDIGIENYEPVRQMYRRCVEFLPVLRGAVVDAAQPVRVGLRPFRPEGVRLEHQPGTRIVHNYGHGGSGVTYSWGCGLEVVKTVEQILSITTHQEGRDGPEAYERCGFHSKERTGAR